MTHGSITRRLAAALVALTLGACTSDAPETPTSLAPAMAVRALGGHAHANPNPAVINQWLAGLRRVTAPYHRFDAAVAAGYGARITPCMEAAGTGGMGYHYGNPLLIDGVVEPLAPELLLFEPQKNGRKRLVAVEYIVPFEAWTGAEPPVLNGLVFHRNEVFQVWALHVWMFEHNPAGMFADWNPRITCRYAPPEPIALL